MVTTNSASFSYLSTAGNRFSGLASGMEIDSIVEKLMKAESAKMEKLQQQKQKYEWQRDSYRSINTKLEAFRLETSATGKYKPSSFLAKKATVSDTSKLDATAASNASGNLTISSVDSLASNGVATSTFGVKSDTTMEAFINDPSKFDAEGNASLTLKVFKKATDANPTEITIKYNKNDTLQQFTDKINKQGGVTAVIGSDGNGGSKFSLSSDVTGKFDGGSIQLGSDGAGVLSKLNISVGANNEIANGSNAKYTVNGVELESKTNTFSQNSYTITLKNTFSNGNVNITSSTDTDSIVDQVSSFVGLYNSLIDSLNSSINEKQNRKFPPLTDSQKAGMSEDQIKKWEAMAKQGILQNDSAISAVLSNMRSAIYSAGTDKDGQYNALYKIGITTSEITFKNGKMETDERGKLVIDEDKLRKAIEANPDAIADLLTRSAKKNDDTDKGGLITQLRDIAKSGIDSIAKKAGKENAVENTFTIGKNLLSVESKINEWKTKLKSIEDRYFKQFSAMEKAIQKANSQSSMFMQG